MGTKPSRDVGERSVCVLSCVAHTSPLLFFSLFSRSSCLCLPRLYMDLLVRRYVARFVQAYSLLWTSYTIPYAPSIIHSLSHLSSRHLASLFPHLSSPALLRLWCVTISPILFARSSAPAHHSSFPRKLSFTARIR